MSTCSCAIKAAGNTQCECMACAQERAKDVTRGGSAGRNVDYSAFQGPGAALHGNPPVGAHTTSTLTGVTYGGSSLVPTKAHSSGAFVSHDYSSFNVAQASGRATHFTEAVAAAGPFGNAAGSDAQGPPGALASMNVAVGNFGWLNLKSVLEWEVIQVCFPQLMALALAEGSVTVGDVEIHPPEVPATSLVPGEINVWGGIAGALSGFTLPNTGYTAPQGHLGGSPDDIPTLGVSPGSKSPASDRICIAVSRGGRSWLKTGLVLADGSAVPCLAVEGGVLYAFFNMAVLRLDKNLEPFSQVELIVAYTVDLANWHYHSLTFDFLSIEKHNVHPVDGSPITWSTESPMDPTVVADPSGGWNLYVTLAREANAKTSTSEKLGTNTFVLQATTLSSFTWKPSNVQDVAGTRVFPTQADEDLDINVAADDPNLAWLTGSVSGTFLQYFASPGQFGVAYNHDVRLTESARVYSVVTEGQFEDYWNDSYGVPWPIHMTNGATIGTDQVWYAMAQVTQTARDTGVILSYTWDAATETWVIDNGGAPILVPDQVYDARYVIDAAVTQFKGCYVMAYTTGIP